MNRLGWASALGTLVLFFMVSGAAASGPPRSLPSAVDTKRGLQKCRLCHGKDYAGRKKAPALAGAKVRQIKAALTTKTPRAMAAIARGLSADEKRAIAEQLAAMPKPPSK